MGKIICPAHGDSGIALVCPHIRACVLSGKPVAECLKWDCDVEGFALPHWFCRRCLDALYAAGLPVSGFKWESIDDDEMLQGIFEQVGIEGEPVCGECFLATIGVLANEKSER
jgi:hypothetical protein